MRVMQAGKCKGRMRMIGRPIQRTAFAACLDDHGAILALTDANSASDESVWLSRFDMGGRSAAVSCPLPGLHPKGYALEGNGPSTMRGKVLSCKKMFFANGRLCILRMDSQHPHLVPTDQLGLVHYPSDKVQVLRNFATSPLSPLIKAVSL